MSTVAEIEAAIGKLPPEDFRTLHEWMTQRAAGIARQKWSPEELSEGARRMLAEPDPARAQALWEQTVAGFYGDARA